MRRFWVEIPLAGQVEARLSGDVLHHIRDVCRFEEGDKFELLPGDQKAYFVELISLSKKDALVRVLEARPIPELPKPYIHLCLSLPRFATIDAVIEKSVELGVKRLTPFFSDYSFVKDARKLGSEKMNRWQKIVRSASQQCGRGELLQISQAIDLKILLEDFNRQTKVVGLFAYEGEAKQSVKEALQKLKSLPLDEIWVFVGSEGGFSKQELDLFKENQMQPATLGDQVLRVETACVALVSIIKYDLSL